MVNAQKWLEENYPERECYKFGHIKKEGKKVNRNEVEKIYLNEPSLEGELDLENFTFIYLKVYISPQVDETKLTFKNLPEDAKIIISDAQKYLDYFYPKNGTCMRKNEGWKSWKSEEINNLGKKREEITELDISEQELEGILNLNDFPNLKEFGCDDNSLTNIILPTNSTNLKELYLCGNNFHQDLSFLVPYTNLEELDLSNNKFNGSLSYLSEMKKLKGLGIGDTDIDRGLEYLPKSIEEFYCSFTKRPEARVSDIWEELQPFERTKTKDGHSADDSGLKNWRKVKLDKRLPLTISPLLPPQLTDKIKKSNKFRENYGIPNTNYNEIHFSQWKEKDEPSSKELPTRLYGFEKNEVENTENQKGKYAILSYVWGDPNMKTNEEIIEKYGLKTKENLNISGNKALYKAIRACVKLDINYLWMDQLCINQNDNEDKSEEVSKMRQYYSNADYTLISINTELGDISEVDLMDILKAIIRSEWFTRSWTFQEGWLSKHTIFMFDDKLIDGWAMAGTWALNQLGYVGEGRYNSRREFDKGTKKIATPVGWTYFRDGYNENDKVTLTLNQALKEIKNRKRSIPVDGIYSILGLLPYGGDEEIIIDYSKNNTPEKILRNLMKVASKNNYVELIAWHGESDGGWMPLIDEYGSISIDGGVKVKGKLFLQKKDILLLMTTIYLIKSADPNIYKRESGFEVEGGLYERKVELKPFKGKYKKEEEFQEQKKTLENTWITLLGTKKTMKLVREDIFLAIPDEGEFESLKPFALLLKDTGEKDEYGYNCHRLGLVELGTGSEKLKLKKGHDRVIIPYQVQEQIQSQIEQSPK